MKGFQLTFMTEQGRRIDGKPAVEWLLATAKEIGIPGATAFAGMESFGHDGRRHSAHFVELSDLPVQVMMAVTTDQATGTLQKVGQVTTRLFYTKSAIEYGFVGSEAAT